jgi:hypothetical protein
MSTATKSIESGVRQGYRNLAVDELVTRPVTALLGVSDDAANLMKMFGIHTIFDLGVSELFRTARLLADLGSLHEGPFAHFKQIPIELLDNSVQVSSPEELAAIPLSSLRRLSNNEAARLEQILGV